MLSFINQNDAVLDYFFYFFNLILLKKLNYQKKKTKGSRERRHEGECPWDIVGNMHICSGKLNGSTSFTIYNMHYVNFRIQV